MYNSVVVLNIFLHLFILKKRSVNYHELLITSKKILDKTFSAFFLSMNICIYRKKNISATTYIHRVMNNLIWRGGTLFRNQEVYDWWNGLLQNLSFFGIWKKTMFFLFFFSSPARPEKNIVFFRGFFVFQKHGILHQT